MWKIRVLGLSRKQPGNKKKFGKKPPLPPKPPPSGQKCPAFPRRGAMLCICLAFPALSVNPWVQQPPAPPPDPPHIQRFRILPPFFILYSQPLNRFIAIESIITVRSPRGRASVLNLPMTVLPTSRSDKRDIRGGGNQVERRAKGKSI